MLIPKPVNRARTRFTLCVNINCAPARAMSRQPNTPPIEHGRVVQNHTPTNTHTHTQEHRAKKIKSHTTCARMNRIARVTCQNLCQQIYLILETGGAFAGVTVLCGSCINPVIYSSGRRRRGICNIILICKIHGLVWK